MTKRIFRSVFLTAFAVMLACIALIVGALYSYFSARQEAQLATEVRLAAAGVEARRPGLSRSLGRRDGLRLTWIAADGAVLYDSNADAAAMENHADREEFAEALETGSGEGRRVSATLSEKTVYIALRLSDGTVLRAAASHYTVPTLLFGILQPLILIIVLAVALSAFLAIAAFKAHRGAAQRHRPGPPAGERRPTTSSRPCSRAWSGSGGRYPASLRSWADAGASSRP